MGLSHRELVTSTEFDLELDFLSYKNEVASCTQVVCTQPDLIMGPNVMKRCVQIDPILTARSMSFM